MPHKQLPEEIKKTQIDAMDAEIKFRENVNAGKVFVSYLPSKTSKVNLWHYLSFLKVFWSVQCAHFLNKKLNMTILLIEKVFFFFVITCKKDVTKMKEPLVKCYWVIIDLLEDIWVNFSLVQ